LVDFVRNELAKEGISRAASIGGWEIVANLASRMERNDVLVICTDGSPHEELFDPIRRHFRQVIFLDRYVREDQGARELLSQLPRFDEAVDALLAQLVATSADVFAGTLFSTFTGLIHRMRGFADPQAEFLYCYSDFCRRQFDSTGASSFPWMTAPIRGIGFVIPFLPMRTRGCASGQKHRTPPDSVR
jgi:hypothetical protein